MMDFCIFHKWVTVADVNHGQCGRCYQLHGNCPHSFKVCSKCGKAVGYGSRGKLTVIPDNCKPQIEYMQWLKKTRHELFKQRMENNPTFTDDELTYAATTLCPCGHGLAYPKDCGMQHYWDCSAILRGIADRDVEHVGQLPFSFYKVKSESDYRGTTRGVFRPKGTVKEKKK